MTVESILLSGSYEFRTMEAPTPSYFISMMTDDMKEVREVHSAFRKAEKHLKAGEVIRISVRNDPE